MAKKNVTPVSKDDTLTFEEVMALKRAAKNGVQNDAEAAPPPPPAPAPAATVAQGDPPPPPPAAPTTDSSNPFAPPAKDA